MMAPTSWITFTRNDQTVSCTTRTCAYFIVPFRVQKVDQVIKIGHRKRAGKTERQRSLGRTTDKTVHVDGEGFLQIYGPGEQVVEVSVSPVSLDNVVKKSNDFLQAADSQSTTIFAIANWKFGGIMGGVLSMFTLLYVVGYSLEILTWIWKMVRKPFKATGDR